MKTPFECDNCGHKPAPQNVVKNHGDCEKCGDTVICYTVDAAECIARLSAALEDIEREAGGALNNAFPDEAPDVLANVAGIARRAAAPTLEEEIARRANDGTLDAAMREPCT